MIVVDVQKDFCPGGALEVPQGDQVIPGINRARECAERENRPVMFSRDWHPRKTVHFQDKGGQWPPHCIQNTPGAEFCPGLNVPEDYPVFSKGMDPQYDGYSAFDGVDEQGRQLDEFLRRKDIEELYVAGLATDYCVKATCLDALDKGYRVYVLEDAIRGVDPDDSREAVEKMKKQGARFIQVSGFCRE